MKYVIQRLTDGLWLRDNNLWTDRLELAREFPNWEAAVQVQLKLSKVNIAVLSYSQAVTLLSVKVFVNTPYADAAKAVVHVLPPIESGEDFHKKLSALRENIALLQIAYREGV